MGTRRRFLRGLGATAAVATAGCQGWVRTLEGAPSQPPTETAGAQFRGGITRRGVVPERTAPSAVTVDWRHGGLNTGDHTAAKASPVQAPNGDVVVTGDSGAVWAVRPNGEFRWRVDATDIPRGFHGTPLIANGTVYVGAYDGALYAFDLATGERYWRTQLGDAIGSSPGYHDGLVYIAVEYVTPSGAIFALDAITGEVVWRDRRITDHPHSTCAIDRDSGRLVVGANDGNLYAWSYPEREFLWTYATGEEIKGPIATADGSAFFGSWSDRVYRISLADGREEWATDVGASIMSGPAVEPATGTVYIGDMTDSVYALAADNGETEWRTVVGGPVIGCPTVTDEHVLVGSYEPAVRALGKATGEQVWSIPTAGWVTSTPLVTADAIYVTDRASVDSLEGNEGKTGGLYRLV